MARPNNSTLLLPLMAVFALIFPFAFSPRPPASSGGPTLSHPANHNHHDDAHEGKAPSDGQKNSDQKPNKDESHNAERILTHFFGDTSIQEGNPQSPIRKKYQLEFLFVTVPDPVDSRLPYLFDRSLTSIQRASEAASYVLASFDLPWLDEIRARAAANSDSESSVGGVHDHHHEYQTQPGYLLF